MMWKLFLLGFLSFYLCACATPSTKTISELQQGKRYFDDGYYKRAMRLLLPLACDGNPQAQYAVGYMYYYGYGVAQDTDTGYFWIRRSADQHDVRAEKALLMIEKRPVLEKNPLGVKATGT